MSHFVSLTALKNGEFIYSVYLWLYQGGFIIHHMLHIEIIKKLIWEKILIVFDYCSMTSFIVSWIYTVKPIFHQNRKFILSMIKHTIDYFKIQNIHPWFRIDFDIFKKYISNGSLPILPFFFFWYPNVIYSEKYISSQ